MTCVYVIRQGDAVKVGISEDPHKRRGSVRLYAVGSTVVVAAWDVGTREQAFAVERGAHRFLGEKWIEGEWFSATDEEAEAAIRRSAERVGVAMCAEVVPAPHVNATQNRRAPWPAMQIVEAAIPGILQDFGLTREEFDRDLEEWLDARTDKRTRYAEGYHARFDALDPSDNPHAVGTYEHTTWRKGWREADEWEREQEIEDEHA